MTQPRLQSAKAFTLVELMMGTAISAFLMIAITSTYVLSTKAYTAVTNYRLIHANGRRAIDLLTKDVRGVCTITGLTTNTSPITLNIVVPTAFSSAGTVTASKTVTYRCYNCIDSTGQGYLYRADSSAGNNTMIATNISSFKLSIYDRLGSNSTLLSTCKGIQVEIRLRKRVISTIQSEDYLSARLDMRNK